jgi:GrpB-like predicted nucleotidyltransferase (UPF0157 family)
MRRIVVVDYDPGWVAAFERVRARVWPAVSGVALSIEHVGSTSVPGLAAKPIIDVSVVVRGESDAPLAIGCLESLGYVHRGNLGIEGREAFDSPDGLPAHHLYLCPRDGPGLANHLAVRDYLRGHPGAVTEYGALKKRLAEEFPHDMDSYIAGKTDMLLAILRAAQFSAPRLEAIERENRK